MNRKPFFYSLLFTFSFLLLPFNFLFADATSTNYKLESERTSAGGVFQITSTNYKIEESSLDLVSKGTFTSTNYTVDGSPGFGASLVPIVNSITPGNFSKFFIDDSPSFTVSAQDPDLDSMEYQLKLDSVVKDAWQSSNVLTHVLSGSDRGRHTYTVEVRDNSDGTTHQDQFSYVFRRPVK